MINDNNAPAGRDLPDVTAFARQHVHNLGAPMVAWFDAVMRHPDESQNADSTWPGITVIVDGKVVGYRGPFRSGGAAMRYLEDVLASYKQPIRETVEVGVGVLEKQCDLSVELFNARGIREALGVTA